MNLLSDLQKNGFLQTKQIENEELSHIATPCVFRIESDIVQSLKKNYISTEEIGGVLSAKPTLFNDTRIFIIDSVSYVRNAIEDKPRTDGRNKTNAYCPDFKQLNQVISNIIENGCLPIRFHTHPTKGKEYLQTILRQNYQTETSDQDKIASEYPFEINRQKLLMPRCLIVGNSITSTDIFIGVYGGFIAPLSFEESKKKVVDEKIKKSAEFLSTVEFTKGQKIGLAVGAALLLFSIIKYPKYSLPVIACLALTAPILLTNTQNIERPEYFNRLSFGKADIYIP